MYRSHTVFDEMFDAMRDLDSAFGRPLRAVPGCRGAARKHGTATFRPAVDCLTRENDYVIRAELPGIDPKAVEITVHEGRLILSGEKKTSFEDDKTDLYVRESSHGKFQRSFTLPEEVESNRISATFENGVLEIVIPKSEERKPRKIPVLTDPRDEQAA